MTTSGAEHARETLACLTIDDPLLRPKYGCLEYERLLDEMRLHNFFTEIAFIPWNYRRSSLKTVRLLADNADHYAICVHGCNHTGNEFGGGNYEQLAALSATSLWRMEEHKRLTGLPYDPVIVFPQGRFSSVAMRVLKQQGYLAAFNSTLRATDGEEPLAVEQRTPFTNMYYGFPLFLRRYPRDKSQFVQDLAAGRPIIIVQHPEAFRNGYKAMTDLVDWINGLGRIKWTSLSSIAEYYLGVQAGANPRAHKIAPRPAGPYLSAQAASRRYLSELRDNYVLTNGLLAKAYKMVRG